MTDHTQIMILIGLPLYSDEIYLFIYLFILFCITDRVSQQRLAIICMLNINRSSEYCVDKAEKESFVSFTESTSLRTFRPRRPIRDDAVDRAAHVTWLLSTLGQRLQHTHGPSAVDYHYGCGLVIHSVASVCHSVCHVQALTFELKAFTWCVCGCSCTAQDLSKTRLQTGLWEDRCNEIWTSLFHRYDRSI